MRWEELHSQIADMKKILNPKEPIQIGDAILPDWARKEDIRKWSIWRKHDYKGEGSKEICARVSMDGDIFAFVDQHEMEFENADEFQHFLRQNGFTQYVGTDTFDKIKP